MKIYSVSPWILIPFYHQNSESKARRALHKGCSLQHNPEQIPALLRKALADIQQMYVILRGGITFQEDEQNRTDMRREMQMRVSFISHFEVSTGCGLKRPSVSSDSGESRPPLQLGSRWSGGMARATAPRQARHSRNKSAS